MMMRNEELYGLYISFKYFRKVKFRTVGRVGHVTRMGIKYMHVEFWLGNLFYNSHLKHRE
jgi:hypothetical protein